MTAARYLVGSAHERMAELPDRSVDLVMTSPPFLALRSYLPPGHPAKAQELGSEETPADYLDNLLALTDEWRRLLTPHGSICVELGDSYAGSGGSGGDYAEDGRRAGQARWQGTDAVARTRPGGQRSHAAWRGQPDGWPRDKSLCGIPAAYQLSLAYGRNVLTGEESPAGAWRVRNLVAWVRPNPPVGALGDKFRPASSYLVVATLARDRYFDLDAVTAPADSPTGSPPLDWWEIAPGGYGGAHYAVYPPGLCERPIEAMCPRRVCRACGRASRRLVATRPAAYSGLAGVADSRASGAKGGPLTVGATGVAHGDASRATRTIGWTSCGCPGTEALWADGWVPLLAEIEAARAAARRRRTPKAERARILADVLPPLYASLGRLYRGRLDGYHPGPAWRPGHVLDPFGGTGTTAIAATGRSRDCTLIDLDERNAHLARQRLGLLLTEDEPAAEAVEEAAS